PAVRLRESVVTGPIPAPGPPPIRWPPTAFATHPSVNVSPLTGPATSLAWPRAPRAPRARRRTGAPARRPPGPPRAPCPPPPPRPHFRLGPAPDLVDDAKRFLAPGIVGGDHH